MKPHSPVLTPGALASVASRKTVQVQRKLREAETRLHTANEVLVDAGPEHVPKDIETAVKDNLIAEETVHAAAEELKEVKELLADANAALDAPKAKEASNQPPKPAGKTGHGARSLIPLLDGRNA